MNIKELDKNYVAATYARFPVCLKEGSGSRVVDDEGKEYIDLGTGIARFKTNVKKNTHPMQITQSAVSIITQINSLSKGKRHTITSTSTEAKLFARCRKKQFQMLPVRS